jgi:antirestriction protein ArdC
MNVYELVTNRIIDKLQTGIVPWHIPWSTSGMARNYVSQKPYRGINSLLLDAGEYLTFKQVQSVGGKVKKGAKSTPVVFWKWFYSDVNDKGEVSKRPPIVRYYNVFHLDQTEGIESKTVNDIFNHDPIVLAENIVNS